MSVKKYWQVYLGVSCLTLAGLYYVQKSPEVISGHTIMESSDTLQNTQQTTDYTKEFVEVSSESNSPEPGQMDKEEVIEDSSTTNMEESVTSESELNSPEEVTKVPESSHQNESNKTEKKPSTRSERDNIPPAKIVGEDPNLEKKDAQEINQSYDFSIKKNQTTQEFIHSIGKIAQKVAWDNDLYASVMIAQAILETGSGNSQLSRGPNYNLFGIKGEFKGESVHFRTNEDDGQGNIFEIQAGFRKYPSYQESLEDYAQLFRTGIAGNSLFYEPTWKKNTKKYQDVTTFLTGRYATDTFYNKKLDGLIEAYQLTQYDQSLIEEKKSHEKTIKIEKKQEKISQPSKKIEQKGVPEVNIQKSKQSETKKQFKTGKTKKQPWQLKRAKDILGKQKLR